MNKKLLLALYVRSGLGAYMPVDYKGHELEVEKHMEKFAELIVRECANIANKQFTAATGLDDRDSWTAAEIKKHFGVEE